MIKNNPKNIKFTKIIRIFLARQAASPGGALGKPLQLHTRGEEAPAPAPALLALLLKPLVSLLNPFGASWPSPALC